MRILLISDIHANVVALEAVLADAEGLWDQIWCLGDVIGYGPNPNESVALLQELDVVCLAGNHDWAALGKIDISIFNPEAKKAINWTSNEINEESRAYLDALPESTQIGAYTLAHASPRDPIWEYVVGVEVARANFEIFETPYCLIGHSHVALRFTQEGKKVSGYGPGYGVVLDLKGARHMINPGSVGQPRDSDPRAAYGLLDIETDRFEHCRVEYDIKETQSRMLDRELPTRLIDRLSKGW